MKIPLAQIRLPEHDLRATIDEDALDELAASLRDRGQKQAIGVRPLQLEEFGQPWNPERPEITLDYVQRGLMCEIVFGARRYRAAQLLDWVGIRAEFTDNVDDENTAADKLIENVQRENLSPIEEGHGLLALIGDAAADVRKLQRQTGKSRGWITDRLELVSLPDDVQGAVQAGVLGIGAARYLGKISNDTVRMQFIEYAVESGCTTETAKIWLSQAQYAEAGISDEPLTPEQIEKMSQRPEVLEQLWPCFGCHEKHSYRTINTLVLCGRCQDAISEAREHITAAQSHLPTTTTAPLS